MSMDNLDRMERMVQLGRCEKTLELILDAIKRPGLKAKERLAVCKELAEWALEQGRSND